jgi:hypothetical protein
MEKGGAIACYVSPLVEAQNFASTIGRNGLASFAQVPEFAATEKSNIIANHARLQQKQQDHVNLSVDVITTAQNICARIVCGQKAGASTGIITSAAKNARGPKKLEQTTTMRQPRQRTAVLAVAAAGMQQSRISLSHSRSFIGA